MKVKGVRKLHTITGHRDSVYTVQQGKNAHDVFSAGGDGMVVHWDMRAPETGGLVAKLPNSVFAVHYLPNEDKILASQNFEGIHLLDYVNKKEEKSLQLTRSYIFDVQSLGNRAYVAGGDGVVYVVDMEEWIILDRLE
ncbi:MAG TPA: WD40 repeat domain-containing protein, partial [Cyclobacteriaceae bacterium]|nr:WD40 repeat domain-containing protein [Cyclobacteriaceae bacterium]